MLMVVCVFVFRFVWADLEEQHLQLFGKDPGCGRMAGIGGLLVLALCIATALTAGVDTRAEPATTYMDIRMKGAHPSKVGWLLV